LYSFEKNACNYWQSLRTVYSSMTDDALVAGCLEGSNRHFNELYDTYSHVLYGICLRYSRNSDDAYDIFQEGFIKVFQHLKTFDIEKGPLRAWLKKVFVNQSIDYYRRKSKMIHTVSADVLSEDLEDDDADTEPGITEEQIMELIQELPDGFRTVFNLFAIEKLKHKEIADLLGITESTSKTQYIRAKKIMQDKIKRFYTINKSIA
jgi:RNA polymerase sigma factor (sigma-70 family)